MSPKKKSLVEKLRKPSGRTVKAMKKKMAKERQDKLQFEFICKELAAHKQNQEKQDTQDLLIQAQEEEKEEITKRESCQKKKKLSICVPDSIIDNAQSKELKTYLVGQIGRAAAVYNVVEIVIFKESRQMRKGNTTAAFFARNLQFLETPQYLRKQLFPLHQDLSLAGIMNPLDCPHHVRITEWSEYREGAALPRPIKEGKGSWANIGLTRDCQLNMEVPQGVRVTVYLDQKEKEKFDNIQQTSVKCKRLGIMVDFSGRVVPPTEPSERLGVYWGYQVRIVENFKELLEHEDRSRRYDLTLGTSDKGDILADLRKNSAEFNQKMSESESILLCFGGLEGIEGMLQNLETLEERTALQLFDYYINTCPAQGSRTIRTEEAVLISLAAFQTATQ